MNLLNRALVIFFLLSTIVVTAVFMVVPDAALQVGSQTLAALVPYAQRFENRLLVVVSGVVILIICFVLLWLELRSPGPRSVRIVQVEGGEAEMTTDAVSQRLAHNIDQLPEIIRVMPRVQPRKETVNVTLDVETGPDVHVPQKTQEIIQVAREVVEQRMGLKLGKVRVNIKHGPYGKGQRPAARPAPEPGPAGAAAQAAGGSERAAGGSSGPEEAEGEEEQEKRGS